MKATAVNRSYRPAAYRFPNEAVRKQKLEKLLDWTLMAATCAAATAILMFFFVVF